MLPRNIQLSLTVPAAIASFLLPLPCQANQGNCGQPVTNGVDVVATDAHRELTTGIGASSCSDVFDACICDVNHNGIINSADALVVLQKATGQNVILDCGPNCPTVPSATLPTSTTSSTSTTSTTTSTTSTTTTTTMTSVTSTTFVTSTTLEGREGSFFEVTFEIVSPLSTPIGALQFDANYSAAGGTFDGAGFATVCEIATNMGDTIAAFLNLEGRRRLGAGLANGTGFRAPRDIAICRFIDYDGVAPLPENFAIKVTDCTRVDIDILTTVPNCFVSVRSVSACACGDGIVNCVTETCDDGNLLDGDGCSSTCGLEP